ncbi:MAG: metalloregulator ArsR/SmtB family transcription factor [Candidatus Eremiobacterota bacterium]
MKNYVKILKAMGEPARLKLLKILSDKELCVREIEELMSMKQTTVSQQLRRLKEANLVIERKEGWWTYYSLDRFTLYEFIESFKLFFNSIQPDVGENVAEKDDDAFMDKREIIYRKKEFID